MKHVFLFAFLISSLSCFAQVLPSDSLIILRIFGRVDTSGQSYSRQFEGDESEFTYQDSIVYRVIYKKHVTLDQQDLILAIVEAPNSTQHGHQLGYRNIYFIKQQRNSIELIDSICSEQEIPLGDESKFEIIDIGKNKIALLTKFQSTGNSHFENTRDMYLLGIGTRSYLISLNEYDNSAWHLSESTRGGCKAWKYSEDYEILISDKEWYDIKVHRIDYGFSKNCEESFVKYESDKIYEYINGAYVEKK